MRRHAGLRRIAFLIASLSGGSGLLAESTPNSDLLSYTTTTERQAPAIERSPILKRKGLTVDYDYLAPDGSEVRLLVRGDRASMAQFKLPAGHTSSAVAHHTVEELWYVVSGRGQMWRKNGTEEDIVDLLPGVSISLPTGTHFQFRNTGLEALEALGVTVPAWPGAEEAYQVEGKWQASSSSDRESTGP